MDSLKHKSVLILDDEKDLCDLLKEEFESAGASVVVCRTLKEAKEAISKSLFHAILSDVNLPDGNGTTLLDDLKKLAKLPHVYFFTGKSDLHSESVLEKGAMGVFSKPCKIEHIIEAIGLSFLPEDERIRLGRLSVKPPLTVEIYFDGFEDPTTGRMLNIGKRGMFLAVESPLPYVGQAISFKATVSYDDGVQASFEGKAICRWVRVKEVSKFPRGFGVEFSELSKNSIDLLKLVSERAPDPELPAVDSAPRN